MLRAKIANSANNSAYQYGNKQPRNGQNAKDAKRWEYRPQASR